MKQFVLLLVFVFSFLGCKNLESNTDIDNKSKLIEVFKASSSDYPNISVHRGGKGLKNYPENCLETITYVNDSITAIYEIDIAQTKDGQLILMHDNSLDRTTNGSGLVKNKTYNQIKRLNLVDDFGNKTNFRIPLFSEVLEWSRENNVLLTVDIKRSVSQKAVIDAIKKANAEDVCIIITYDVAQAQSAYNLNPNLLLSVSARNHKEFDRLLETNIPTENMLAFTGTRLSNASLYKRLKEKNMLCILGTLGNLDRQAEARGDSLYKNWYSKGVNILATDRPFEAFNAINKKEILKKIQLK
ncbi:MAG: glycerophosphodiester phosphodiesterase family protein [Winogradskyella sp.]|uniref:glycerophosphodiester phosphodiesterase family protein n=1 Tax=Winogradskyella sp. TaxID=1883156 RepID=UPI0025F962AF|nr:glycerophosphodiester phosphodiesterase family protein [Winogradskyella sp.]NRB61337.1 glycerophosphodiester phosphodiesterase family protein [Winogradskyella sp.]